MPASRKAGTVGWCGAAHGLARVAVKSGVYVSFHWLEAGGSARSGARV